MREYTVEELKKLSDNKEEGTFIIKEVPFIEEKGRMDPKVLKRVRLNLKQNNNKAEDVFPNIDLIKNRNAMGGVNNDLTPEGSINTIHEVISFGEYQLALTILKNNQNTKNKQKPFIFLHGGGFLGGSVKALENQLKLISFLSGYSVFSIDYRLAPENPFPAQLNDVENLIDFLRKNAEVYDIDLDYLAIGGESAGANLALVTALESSEKFDKLVLIYPGVTLEEIDKERASWIDTNFTIAEQEKKEIHTRLMRFINLMGLAKNLYCPNEDVKTPRISPLYSDNLNRLRKPLFILPEFDPLTFYSMKLIERLNTQCIENKVIKYLGMDHGFIDRLGINSQTEDALIEIANYLTEE